ncbi:metalloregulator ArsR/SmtB family transcription factor [Moritella sp. 24]|uniref:metalloregulator ArsR/SmtB family transcription factor n=1 Tax=Moritella sp. 24 TaxID=2746230 RepID=UPI001BA701F3|nr:metalloregulator ArsR/SmtB family transcription factor [Moritella sp. 24]QUM76323.1 metalloregulator ArsR/SmtB family transcription factor [Moritella sp. 24]
MDLLQFYKCLADDTRLKSLLLILHEEELCVCELTHALEQSQPKISRHLALLRQKQLVVDRRQGQWVYYHINPNIPEWAQKILALTLVNNVECIQEEVQRLVEMSSRPSRTFLCD